MSDFDKELDTSGLNCPLPIIKAKKEINTMESGQVLHVISTDPGAVMDFESFAGQTGNELLSSESKDNKFLEGEASIIEISKALSEADPAGIPELSFSSSSSL